MSDEEGDAGGEKMLEDWVGYIKRVGIFIICAQALIHFKPKGVYEKYIRLLVSSMILVQLLEPLGNLFGYLEKGELTRRMKEMEERVFGIEQSWQIEEDAESIREILLGELNIEGVEEEK